MKSKITLYSSLVMVAAIMTGCSTAALVEAPNGKTYYIDTAKCDTYKLKKDSMYCYTEESTCQTTIYKPVGTYCKSKVCGSSYTPTK